MTYTLIITLESLMCALYTSARSATTTADMQGISSVSWKIARTTVKTLRSFNCKKKHNGRYSFSVPEYYDIDIATVRGGKIFSAPT